MSVFLVILQVEQLHPSVAWYMMHSVAELAAGAAAAVSGGGSGNVEVVGDSAEPGVWTQVPVLDSVSWSGCVEEFGPGAVVGALRSLPVATTPICASAAAEDGVFEVFALCPTAGAG